MLYEKKKMEVLLRFNCIKPINILYKKCISTTYVIYVDNYNSNKEIEIKIIINGIIINILNVTINPIIILYINNTFYDIY